MNDNVYTQQAAELLLPAAAAIALLAGVFLDFASLNTGLATVGFSIYDLLSGHQHFDALAAIVGGDGQNTVPEPATFYMLLFFFVSYGASCHFDENYLASLPLVGLAVIWFAMMSSMNPLFSLVYEAGLYSWGAGFWIVGLILLFVHSVARTRAAKARRFRADL